MHKKQDGHFLVHKYNGSHHSGLIDKTNGAFKQIVTDSADTSTYVNSFREYKGKYLINFMYESKIYITENGQRIFTSQETFKGGYTGGNNYNFTRNVDLKDDKLYFVNSSNQLIEYDLLELLALPDKTKYKGKVLATTAIIDFCVSADHTATTLTNAGVLTNLKTGRSVTVNTANRGAMTFTSIEQLDNRIVTEGLNASTNKKYYVVFDESLNEVASKEVAGSHCVHNMLLFKRDGLLWILAANSHLTVDLLALNSDELALVHTLTVSSGKNRTFGMIWKEVGAEAIVFGDLQHYTGQPPLLKSFKV